MQLNYLIDEGGFVYSEKDGTFRVDFTKVKSAVEKLTREILTLQAEGSKEKAKVLLDTYGINRSYTKAALDSISSIPVDIASTYPQV